MIKILVPTLGRPSLSATLESIWLDSDDEDDIGVWVLCDGGNIHEARRIFDQYSGRNWWFDYYDPQRGYWGHAVCNEALDKLQSLGQTSHVARMDDDDTYTVGAIPTLINCQADVPVIFRARWGEGHEAAGVELPLMHEVRYGNIATPMVLAPVCNARYGLDYGGDFSYVTALVEELGEPIWRDELICVVRPEAV